MQSAQQEYVTLPHSIYKKNAYGRIEEKVEFPEVAPGIYDICNVYSAYDDGLVDVTDRLLTMAVQFIREKGGKIVSSDMYIGRWLERHRIHRYVKPQ